MNKFVISTLFIVLSYNLVYHTRPPPRLLLLFQPFLSFIVGTSV